MELHKNSDNPIDHNHIAIIDIGSNSVRLVVYDGMARAPVIIFNEKAICALGKGMEASNRLNPEGKKDAIPVLMRFARLIEAMKVVRVHILATSAVRDASDGPDFVQSIEEACHIPVTTLSGEEEARLAALGVLCGIPDAHGMVADLGGGSLELIAVDNGQFSGHAATMPLGVLRLWDASHGQYNRASKIIDKYFSSIDLWPYGKDRTLYCVGGAWRSLAKLYIAQTGHPLHVLDNFTLKTEEAFSLTSILARQNKKSLEKNAVISRKRLPYMPMAALILEKILHKANPKELVFSVYGLREGQFFQDMPQEMKEFDPLITSCADMARTTGRFSQDGEEIFHWMDQLFPDESKRQKRLRLAACHLGDLFWNENPDYRAEHAFLRVFRLPFMGLGHQDRAALALAIYARYDGRDNFSNAADAIGLLPPGEDIHWQRVGMALRIGYFLSGGATSLLRLTKIAIKKNIVQLTIPAGDPVFALGFSERRYERTLRLAGLDAIEILRAD